MSRSKSIQIMPAMRDWYRQHVAEPLEQARQAKHERAVKRYKSKVRTPATPDDLLAIAVIAPGMVTYLPGSHVKRFAQQIQGETELTDRQRDYVWSTVWHYRRQIRDQRLVDLAKARKDAE